MGRWKLIHPMGCDFGKDVKADAFVCLCDYSTTNGMYESELIQHIRLDFLLFVQPDNSFYTNQKSVITYTTFDCIYTHIHIMSSGTAQLTDVMKMCLLFTAWASANRKKLTQALSESNIQIYSPYLQLNNSQDFLPSVFMHVINYY